MLIKSIHRIDKAELENVTFKKDEVLSNDSDKIVRKSNLMRGLALGNLHKRHVVIQFENIFDMQLEVETTIWAVTQNHIMLKGGKIIPIRCIFNVVL
ncbi:MAG: hypothetical protein AAF843_10030 [Bacteroidota bacterium]|mgnify:CR=1 FL=1